MSMAFYIKPPTGRLSYARLQSLATTRLEFLLNVAHCHGNTVVMKDLVEQVCTAADSDCLIEGSGKDQTSHFLLRLACSQDEAMCNFFILAETKLFQYRLSCMTNTELTSAVKPLRRFHRLLTNSQDKVSKTMSESKLFLDSLTRDFSWESLISNYSCGSRDRYIVVPFHYALGLVSKRAVVIDKGLAHVPCCKLSELLIFLFEKMLTSGMTDARKQLQFVLDDERMNKLFQQLKTRFHVKYRPFGQSGVPLQGYISCEEVDQLLPGFPLCMSHLHRHLRNHHRLKHFSRIQYTLFLKELGLPVHEALNFWRQEYSLTGCHGNSCTHSWQNDGRRYTYNIRHLYGLEGCRRNYRGHCCTSIQEMILSSGEQGGCPFVHFDVTNLQKDLSLEGVATPSQTDILAMAANQQPSKACELHLLAKSKATVRGRVELSDILENSQVATNSVRGESSSMCCAGLDKLHVSTDSGYESILTGSVDTLDVSRRDSNCSGKRTYPGHSQGVRVKKLRAEGKEQLCSKGCPSDPRPNVDTTALLPWSTECHCDRGVYPASQQDVTPTQRLENSFQELNILIHRPLDFCSSYTKLLDGIQK